MINKNTVLFRAEAWKMAQQLIDPLIEKHGINDTIGGAPAFSRGMPITKVDQHQAHITDLADWLLTDMADYAEVTHIPSNIILGREQDD